MARQLSLTRGRERRPVPTGGGILVTQVELSTGVGDIAVPGSDSRVYSAVRLLVRLHGQPLGFATLPLAHGRLGASQVAELVWEHLHAAVNAHLVDDALEPATCIPLAGLRAVQPQCCRRRAAGAPDGPLVTVVVCTRDRPRSLAHCLRALAQVTYASFEVVVVDNAPSTRETLAVVQELSGVDPRVRYVRDRRPGLFCDRRARS